MFDLVSHFLFHFYAYDSMLILTTKDTDTMNTLETSLLVYWIATDPILNGFFWESTDKNSINSLNKFQSIYGLSMSMNTSWHSPDWPT